MSDALYEIEQFVDTVAQIPYALVGFVSEMPGWFVFSIGLSVVLGIIIIIWRIIE